MINNIKTAIKSKYFTYIPGEFFPVYSGGELINKSEFHKYRISWILKNHKVFAYQLTHTKG